MAKIFLESIIFYKKFTLRKDMSIPVTGGAGIIGSNFVQEWLAQSIEQVINIDNLTYAGNLQNLNCLNSNPLHVFVQSDIADSELILNLLNQYKIRAVINFAAESHVDRSILGPAEFISKNIVGTFNLLEAVRAFWGTLSDTEKNSF